MACRWIVTIAMFICSTSNADPAPPPIDEAIKEAFTSGKPLIVEMYTTWCGPCKKFESDTLTDSRVKTALQALTFVRYDAEEAPGDAVAARFHVSGYPTLFALDASGVEVARTSGALSPNAFLTWVDTARAAMQTERQILASILTKPSVETHLAAAKWYENRKRVDKAVSHHKWIAKSRTATPEQRKEAIRVSARLQRLAAWRSDLVAEKVAAIRAAPQEATLDDLALVTVESGASPTIVREICVAFLAARTFRTNLNNAIYVALAAGATDEALVAAKRLVEQRPSAMFLDTLAECHHMRGEHAEALAASDQARALLSPDSPLWEPYSANRARFEKGSGESRESSAIRIQIGHFWEHLADVGILGLERVLQASGGQRSQYENWRASIAAQNKVERDVARNCLEGTGIATHVHAYVKVDSTDRLALTSLLAETRLPAATQRCIRHEIAVATLPYENGERLLKFQVSALKGRRP